MDSVNKEELDQCPMIIWIRDMDTYCLELNKVLKTKEISAYSDSVFKMEYIRNKYRSQKIWFEDLL